MHGQKNINKTHIVCLGLQQCVLTTIHKICDKRLKTLWQSDCSVVWKIVTIVRVMNMTI